MARASTAPIASGPAVVHRPNADGRSVETWKRVPPASPDVPSSPGRRQPEGQIRPRRQHQRARVLVEAGLDAGRAQGVAADVEERRRRRCDADPRRARLVDLRLRQQQPLGGADGAGIDPGLGEKRLELLRRHAPAPRVRPRRRA